MLDTSHREMTEGGLCSPRAHSLEGEEGDIQTDNPSVVDSALKMHREH